MWPEITLPLTLKAVGAPQAELWLHPITVNTQGGGEGSKTAVRLQPRPLKWLPGFAWRTELGLSDTKARRHTSNIF